MIIRLTSPNLVYILFRHRPGIIKFFLATSLAAIAYCVIATPRYEGDVDLVVTFSQLHSGAPGDTGSAAPTATPVDREEIINSYLLELQGTDLAREVIDAIGIGRLYPNIVASPSPLDPRSWVTALFAKNPGDLKGKQMDQAVYRFTHKDLTVLAARDSNVINVSLLNPNRNVAQQAVETFVNRFIEREAASHRNPRLEFVSSQVDFYRQKVTDAQVAMEGFSTRTGIHSLEDELGALLQQRTIQEQALATVRTRIVEDQQKSTIYHSRMASLSPLITLTTGTLDPLVQSARESLGTLVTTEGKLRQIYSANSPAVADVKSQIDQMEQIIGVKVPKSQLPSTVPNPTYQEVEAAQIQAQADLDAATKSEQTLAIQLAAINGRMGEISRQMATFQNLTREYQVADQNYRMYLQAVQEARIDSDLNKQRISSISIFDSAYAPIDPTRPRTLLIVLGGIAFGLLGAFGLACLREQLDERINQPAIAEQLLELPIIGSMGLLPTVAKG